MGKHQDKGKPGYRGWFPPEVIRREPKLIAEVLITTKASAAEIAALDPLQRAAFMAGISSIIY